MSKSALIIYKEYIATYYINMNIIFCIRMWNFGNHNNINNLHYSNKTHIPKHDKYTHSWIQKCFMYRLFTDKTL